MRRNGEDRDVLLSAVDEGAVAALRNLAGQVIDKVLSQVYVSGRRPRNSNEGKRDS